MPPISKLVFPLILFPLVASAQQPASDVLVKSLSSCDARFFRTLRELGPALEKSGPFAYGNDIAYWKVPDRKSEGKNLVSFSKPITGKVKLLGYLDEVVDLEELGRYYSWGFLAEGSPETVAAAIRPLIEDGARLRKDGDVYVRSEIRYGAAVGWVKNDGLKGGVVPGKDTIERVFLVEEAGEGHPGVTRLTCSLQGSVTALILDADRPDLAGLPVSNPDHPVDEATVRRLFEVTNSKGMIDDVMARVLETMKASVAQSLVGRKFTPEQEAVMEEMQGKLVALLKEELKWERLEPVFMKVYLSTFTQDEVDGMIAFYQTKAGQAVIKKLPAVMQTTTVLMQERVKAMTPKIQQIGIEGALKMKQANLPRKDS